MNPQIKKFLIVFGLAGIIYWLVRPGTDRKPLTSKEPNKSQQSADAKIALAAYTAATKAGESGKALEELNQALEKQYGLRVYRKQDGKFYVNDTKGNTILKS